MAHQQADDSGTTIEVATRLQELAVMLSGTDRFVRNVAGGEVWLPGDGAPAEEMRKSEESIAPGDFAWTTLCLLLTAMLDNLGSLRVLLSPQSSTLFGPRIIARSCLEAAARLRWMTDIGADAQEGLRRAHRLRCDGLRYRLKMQRQFSVEDSVVERCSSHLNAACEVAAKHGVAESGVPAHTELARELFAAGGLDRDIGAGIYNGLSGIAHAQPSALLEFFAQGSPPTGSHTLGEDALFLQGAVTLEQLELTVMLTTSGVASTLDTVLPFVGWRTDVWPGWRNHMLKSAFRSALEESHGA